MVEMTVPLVDRGNGLWGSSSPAWDHLINRESSGRPTIIQQIHDVNSGGNEAEGLFQITPATWRANNGTVFAPSARFATPQQQAIVAARIFTRNESGSDWGAGRPGRESAADLKAGLVPIGPIPVPPAPQSYGMPTGSNSGGYGNSGVKFPQWVYDLGNAFGLKPSTYPGHQESDRNEAGYAPNPQHLNRGIDWAAPGAADEVDRMQRFADYLFSVRDQLEQEIWWNPRTGVRRGVAGGKDVTSTPYYDYPGGYDDHRDHVHTRCSHPIPLPGGYSTVPVPLLKPLFTELDFYSSKKVGQGFNVRSRPAINFFIHTEQGNSDAKGLARYCDGSNGVSYHYTLRDRILCDVVDTDYYAWAVLSANVFSINLCFAGSYAEWTREQWLKIEGDIEIAAYIAVQDCRKYGIPTDVIAPPYHEAAGISDHKYVTEQLHIGDHHDVGDNFPWDVFSKYVDKYANASTTPGDDDDMIPPNEWALVRDAILTVRESLSPIRPLEGAGKGDVAQFARWTDGSVHFQACLELAKMGHQPTLDLIDQVANADPVKYPDRQDDAAVCRNIRHQAELFWASQSATSTAVSRPAAEVVSVDPDAYGKLQAANAALQVENAGLRNQLADSRLKAVQAQVTPAAIAIPDPPSTGDHVAKIIDSVESWTKVVPSLDTTQRAALQASIGVLELKGQS